MSSARKRIHKTSQTILTPPNAPIPCPLPPGRMRPVLAPNGASPSLQALTPMSNCVRIDNTISIPNTAINIPALRRLLKRAEDLIQRGPNGNASSWGDDLAAEREAWWFLCGALHFEESYVKWTPGRGCRSSHTWRDLYSTILTLRTYIHAPTRLDMKLIDEDAWGWDAPSSWMKIALVDTGYPIPGRFDSWEYIPLLGHATAIKRNEDYA